MRDNSNKYIPVSISTASRQQKKMHGKPNSNPCKKSVILEHHAFPIYGYQMEAGKLKRTAILGTAFYLNETYFITALHVVNTGEKYSSLKIGFLNQIRTHHVEVYNFTILEKYPTHDIALLSCPDILKEGKKPQKFDWAHDELKVFQEVRAMGYPLGFDSTTGMTHSRGFMGTKIGTMNYKAEPFHANCYELSFQCPRGLSGACLLDGCYNIHGVIFGNANSELEYFYEKEKRNVGDKVEIETLIKSQTTFIGMAVKASEIYGLHSDALKTTFREYMVKNRMISSFVATD